MCIDIAMGRTDFAAHVTIRVKKEYIKKSRYQCAFCKHIFCDWIKPPMRQEKCVVYRERRRKIDEIQYHEINVRILLPHRGSFVIVQKKLRFSMPACLE